jgi:hypothetical protein
MSLLPERRRGARANIITDKTGRCPRVEKSPATLNAEGTSVTRAPHSQQLLNRVRRSRGRPLSLTASTASPVWEALREESPCISVLCRKIPPWGSPLASRPADPALGAGSAKPADGTPCHPTVAEKASRYRSWLRPGRCAASPWPENRKDQSKQRVMAQHRQLTQSDKSPDHTIFHHLAAARAYDDHNGEATTGGWSPTVDRRHPAASA